MTEGNSDQSSRTKTGTRALKAVGITLAVAICVAAMVGGSWLLHFRASAEAGPAANPPVAVQTAVFERKNGYQIEQEFVGRIEPTRETQLAFELNGTVESVDVDEGDTVSDGARIAQLDTARLRARLDELAAERSELEARLALARATAERQSTLRNQGWAAEQRFDEARFEVRRLEAAIQRVDAAVQTVRVDLAKSTLSAPFAGQISSRSIDEGAIVSAGTPVATLLEGGTARVRVGVSREVAQEMKIGTQYKLRVGDQEFEAKLIALRPDLEPQSQTVTALFATEDKGLFPYGTVVILAVPRALPDRGDWVPLTALSEGQKGVWSLMVVTATDDGNQIVRREAVTVLHVTDGRAFVEGSLPDGSSYIVNGTNRVTPGQRVARLAAR